MLVIESKKIKDFDKEKEKYLKDLEYLGYVHYDRALVSNYLNVFEHKVSSLARLVSESLQERTGNMLFACDKSYIINYYQNYKQVPQSLLEANRKEDDGFKYKSASFDRKVADNLRDLGFLDEPGEYFIQYNSAKYIRGQLNTLMKSMSFVGDYAEDGSMLYRVPHQYTLSDSLRTYTEKYNHQGAPKDLRAMRAPKDYVIVSGDFAQSDLKIAYNMFLRDRSNVDIFYRTPDSYRAMAMAVEGDAFDDDDFTVTRDLYKLNTLAPIYGATKSGTSAGQRVMNGVRNFLKDLPAYNRFIESIQKKLDAGLPVSLVSYFGNQANRFKSSNMKDSTILDQSLNWPVQTGTSEVVILTSNHIMREFAKVGATPENGGIYSYLNRHDEPIYLVKKEFLKYSYIFQEAQDIQVDDWMPLRIEFSYHDIYGVKSEELDNYAMSFYREQPKVDIEEIIQVAKRNKKYFIPCKDSLLVIYATVKQNDFTILAIKDELQEDYSMHKIESTNDGKIKGYVANIYDKQSAKLQELGYNSTLIKSYDIEERFVVSGNLTHVFTNTLTTDEHLLAKQHAMHAAKIYAQKQGG